MSTSPGATLALARYIVQARPADLPAAVVQEGVRALLHWAGCAIGGTRHPTVEIAWRALAPFAGPAQASLLGRAERTDPLHAALLNGIASHVLDFDDTHPATLLHPSGPVAAAVMAACEHRACSGAELINAFVVGVEVECRIARAVLPAHYEVGWHVTGTAGVFGAAAAAAKLLALDERHTLWALGIAATQAAGLREMFGSMCKSLHPGRAAQNGLSAALLAASGFNSAERAIEGPRGFGHVLSTTTDFAQCCEGLGERYEILGNTYKPFACGLVIHPAIDGCLQLRASLGLRAADIERVNLRVHPLVIELTGKTEPRTDLEGKFSVFHSAAVALLDGAAGEAQYSDARVNAADVIALRTRVHAEASPGVAVEEAYVELVYASGARHTLHVEHCVGSLERPMSDAQIEAKFLSLCNGVLPADRVERALSLLRQLPELDESARAVRACAAEP